MTSEPLPELLIVVDTEEEFDWSKPFSRSNVATSSIPAQARAHEIYDRFGVVPTYVVDYPVATDAEAVRFLRCLRDSGKAEIGAHLHPWVTPPHLEEVTTCNSYHCNLAPELERAKIEALTGVIERAFRERPNIFKAGRYGFGPNTLRVLCDLGYQVDCSFVPHTDLSGDGGPDYRGVHDAPHWLDQGRGLLEVPLTVGFLGSLAGFGARAGWLFDSPGAGRLRVPGVLARAGLVARSRLTPEGTPADEQCRLITAMAAAGHRTFSLTYHSPSLEPGHTPYVKSEADLARFLGSIETVLAFFRDQLGGRFTTLSQVRRDFGEGRRAAA
ncbi:MAG TPA: polysaccharide deacetylase family protein [Allosphingosinicella sp.]|jgi:hypothetical protein